MGALPWAGFVLLKKMMSKVGLASLLNPANAVKAAKSTVKALNSKPGRAVLQGLGQAAKYGTPLGLAAKSKWGQRAMDAAGQKVRDTASTISDKWEDARDRRNAGYLQKRAEQGRLTHRDLEWADRIGGAGFRAELAAANRGAQLEANPQKAQRSIPELPRSVDVATGVALSAEDRLHRANFVDIQHPEWEAMDSESQKQAMDMVLSYLGDEDHLASLTPLERERLAGGDLAVAQKVPRRTITGTEFEAIMSSFEHKAEAQPVLAQYAHVVKGIRQESDVRRTYSQQKVEARREAMRRRVQSNQNQKVVEGLLEDPRMAAEARMRSLGLELRRS